VEQSGCGIVCYISSFSYLGDPSFVVMRERLLNGFDNFWFDCLNGDSRETGKTTPEGLPDPSVFSTENNKEGIRVGTAIGLMVRKTNHVKTLEGSVHFRHFWGVNKRADLLATLQVHDFNASYQATTPSEKDRFTFRPRVVSAEYMEWPKIIELCQEYPFNGPIERRGNSLIIFDHQRAHLENALKNYLNAAIGDDEVKNIEPRFMLSSGEFKANEARLRLKQKVKFDSQNIVRYPFKPFDLRLVYLSEDIQPLFSRPSPQLLKLREIINNAFIITRASSDKNTEGVPFYFSRYVSDYSCIYSLFLHIYFVDLLWRCISFFAI
jgi:hypothetical protein